MAIRTRTLPASALLKNCAAILFLVITFTTTGCKKGDEKPEPVEIPKPPAALLRKIEWENGIKGEMSYNDDSTLKYILYSYENTAGGVIVNWANGKLFELYDDRSMYKNTYYFNGSQVSHYINAPIYGTSANYYKMEYLYHNDGKLKTLNYIRHNEAGSKILATTDYHYNAAGELSEAVTINNQIVVITHSIESYSEEIDFNPCVYVDASLDENYTIYNYALLSRLKKLPAKLVRKVKIGTGPVETEKIEETTFEVTDKRINKTISKITFPGTPAYNSSTVATYYY